MSNPIPGQNHGALVPRSAFAWPIPSRRIAMTAARPMSPSPVSAMTMSPHHVHHENSTRRACRMRRTTDRDGYQPVCSLAGRLPDDHGSAYHPSPNERVTAYLPVTG